MLIALDISKQRFTSQQSDQSGRSMVSSCDQSTLLNRECAQEGKQFRVMVVDSRPHYEGKAMLAKLLAHGIPCTYLHLNALCYSMQVQPSTQIANPYAAFPYSPITI